MQVGTCVLTLHSIHHSGAPCSASVVPVPLVARQVYQVNIMHDHHAHVRTGVIKRMSLLRVTCVQDKLT